MSMRWVRAKDGALFGVCKGLARALDIPIGLFRIMWVLSIFFLGAGVGLYLILAISLPREDKTHEAMQPWLLGVCSKIAKRTYLEVGVVRFLTICLSLLSMGATVVGYIVLYFVLENKEPQSSDSSPSVPPATT
jgi:phage shock protein PspC (stress-responsive transcriptional regulator)